MNGQLTRRVKALETRGPNGPMPLVVLLDDEPVPDGSDEREVLRISWLSVDVAKARGWR